MSALIDPLLSEFQAEAITTRRILQRVPEAKLAWKPHPKSMALGALAWHIAVVPGNVARLTQAESFDVANAQFNPPVPNSVDEIMTAYEQSVREAEEILRGMTDQHAKGAWRLLRKGQEISSQPRIGVLRSIMLNHWYHHRGQLSVYLRLLDVPVPVIYGPSADESPFG
jgi:uncharacterized damage-inducible protein DinB